MSEGTMNNTLLFDFLQPLEVVRQGPDGPCQFTSRCCSLIYTISGSGSARLEGRHIDLSEGELLLLPPGWYRMEGGAGLMRAAFSISCVSFRQVAPQLFFRPVLLEAGVREHVYAILSSAEEAEPFAVDQIALELHYLLLTLTRSLIVAPPSVAAIDHQEAEALERIISYIQEHLSEEISFQDLIDCSACSSRQVYALFKKRFQTTPIKYLSDYRIETAKHLLLTLPMTITEIATACGFQTVHYFSHAFKLSTGMSPNVFRRQLDVSKDAGH